MKRVIPILFALYFVALGGSATIVSHFCGGNYVGTYMPLLAHENNCCNDTESPASSACSKEEGCNAGSAERSCNTSGNCDSNCCNDVVTIFTLSEVQKQNRTLASTSGEFEIPVITVRMLNTHFPPVLFKHHLPFKTPSPPPHDLQSQLQVFLC